MTKTIIDPSKTRLIFFLSLFFLFFPFINQAQTNASKKTGNLSGKVIDKESGNLMEYVNIVVFNASTNHMISGGITNAKGEFKIDKIPLNVSVYTRISFISYKEHKTPTFTLTAKAPEKNLGKIILESEMASLQAVEIVGEKRAMEYRLDKKVVNVEQNIVSSGGTAVDVLQNVPGINVDADGNVSMKGSDNVSILIDGRPATLSDMGLDQLQANNIESIEIISNPSAKYNPEGMAGILNIKTKKRNFEEVNGLISVSSSTANRHSLAANVNIGLGKVSLFSSLSGNFNQRGGEGSTSTWSEKTSSIYPNDDRQKEFGQSSSLRKGYGGEFKLGADVRFSPKHTLSISGSAAAFDNKRNSDNPNTKTYSYLDSLPYHENHLLQSIDNTSLSSSLFNRYNATIAYRYGFSKPKQELSLDASFDYSTRKGNSLTTRNIQHIDTTQNAQTSQIGNTTGSGYLFDGQINYVHPFNDKIRLELGYQARIRFSGSLEDQSMRLTPLQDTTLDFSYTESQHGIYANFIAEVGKFSFQIGGRYEYATMDASTISENKDTSFHIQYPRFYPSIHAAYKIGKNQEIQLSYSRRVNRPRPWSLNPFVDYSNYPISISHGNSELIPEDVHSLELNHSIFVGKSSFYTSIYYRHIDDVIRRYTFVNEEQIRESTYLNYESGTNYGFNIVWEQEIFKWWRFNLNGGFYRNITKGGEGANVNTEGYSYDFRLNTNFTLPKQIYIQASFNYRGPNYWGQTLMEPSFISEVAIRKSFLNNRLSLSLRVSDIFHTYKHNSTTTGEGFITQSMRRPFNSTAAYISISYKINKGIKNNRSQQRNSNDMNSGDMEMDM